MRSPGSLLGTEHPLVRALDARQIVARHLRVVGAVVASSGVALVAGAHGAAAIAIGGTVALTALALVGASV
ncbi:MAG TPA: hypothetical protein VJU79_04610, partial [Candidatus Dormibacteraeota bacterium]|nr:hypothetical protein [Candidatus Dormibacteraeota bacterium]